MTERPILFNGPMVCALLQGRKTQTRRVVKPQPSSGARWNPIVLAGHAGWEDGHGYPLRSPYGQPGDRLWVRETWQVAFRSQLAPGEIIERTPEVCFAANRGFNCACGHGIVYAATGSHWHPTLGKALWRPSIHMPRWASRITLDIKDIWMERLQDITEADAIAEGLAGISKDRKSVKWGIPDRDGLPGTDNHGWPWADWQRDPRKAYKRLWTQINGPDAWAANPWVWVLSFEVRK